MTTKKYDHEPVEEFVFEEWVREGVKGFRQKVESHIPSEGKKFDTSEFRQHMRNARKEQLLAVRSLLDSAITWIDKQAETFQQEA